MAPFASTAESLPIQLMRRAEDDKNLHSNTQKGPRSLQGIVLTMLRYFRHCRQHRFKLQQLPIQHVNFAPLSFHQIWWHRIKSCDWEPCRRGVGASKTSRYERANSDRWFLSHLVSSYPIVKRTTNTPAGWPERKQNADVRVLSDVSDS